MSNSQQLTQHRGERRGLPDRPLDRTWGTVSKSVMVGTAAFFRMGVAVLLQTAQGSGSYFRALRQSPCPKRATPVSRHPRTPGGPTRLRRSSRTGTSRPPATFPTQLNSKQPATTLFESLAPMPNLTELDGACCLFRREPSPAFRGVFSSRLQVISQRLLGACRLPSKRPVERALAATQSSVWCKC